MIPDEGLSRLIAFRKTLNQLSNVSLKAPLKTSIIGMVLIYLLIQTDREDGVLLFH